MTAEGTATENRGCAPCPAGTWANELNAPASACVPWSACDPGKGVLLEGSAKRDRTCSTEDCPVGSYSTGNTECLPWTTCVAGLGVAGQRVGSPAPSSSRDRTCVACAANQYTASENAAACSDASVCAPGRFGSGMPNCQDCLAGTFSATENAAACTPWTACVEGEYTQSEGTASADRVCAAITEWSSEIANTSIAAMALTMDGGLVAVGRTGNQSFPNVDNPPGESNWGFLRKYKADGTVEWTRRIRFPAKAVAIAEDGNLVVVGGFSGYSAIIETGSEAFVRKLNVTTGEPVAGFAAQKLVLTNEGSGGSGVSAKAVAVDPLGRILVGGAFYNGRLNGSLQPTGFDGYLLMLEPNGTVTTKIFGGDGDQEISGLAVGGHDNGVVAMVGRTRNNASYGTGAGCGTRRGFDGFVARLNGATPTAAPEWTNLYCADDATYIDDNLSAVRVAADGTIVASGYSRAQVSYIQGQYRHNRGDGAMIQIRSDGQQLVKYPAVTAPPPGSVDPGVGFSDLALDPQGRAWGIGVLNRSVALNDCTPVACVSGNGKTTFVRAYQDPMTVKETRQIVGSSGDAIVIDAQGALFVAVGDAGVVRVRRVAKGANL